MAYWTCQFTSSWVCRGLPRFERSYVSVCAHTEHQHRVYDDAFSRQQNTFHPKRRFLLDGARDVKKADAGLGAVPTCAGDQGLWAWVERRRDVCFWVVSFKWGDSYKKHTSRTEPLKARRLSDNHMWSTAQRSIGFVLHCHFNNCATNLYNADPYYTVKYSLCLWIGNWQESLFIYSPARRGTKRRPFGKDSQTNQMNCSSYLLDLFHLPSRVEFLEWQGPSKQTWRVIGQTFYLSQFKASQSDVFTGSIKTRCEVQLVANRNLLQ